MTIPAGCAHLPADRIGATRTLALTSTGAAPYVQEALRLLPEDISSDSDLAKSYPAYAPADGSRARVLLADDNTDMRGYIHRLLSDHYEVEAVADGSAALDAAMRNPPDLILTDIMMPTLDGFGLLRALRADPRTQSIPVIFLSARAGEESKVEGMEAGADDYLVKPFSARELIARVSAHLQIARVRREATLKERELRKELEKELDERKRAEEALRESEARLRRIAKAGRIGFFEWNASKDTAYWSPEHYELFGFEPGSPISWQRWLQSVHPDDRERVVENAARLLERARTEGQVQDHKDEYRFILPDGSVVWLEADLSADMVAGEPIVRGSVRDITERKKAEEKLRESEERFRAVQENSLDRFTILKPFYDDQGEIIDFTYIYQNAQAARTAGRRPEELIGLRMTEIFPTFPQSRFFAMYKLAIETGQATEFEARYQTDGVDDWFCATVTPIPDGIAIATQIITDRKRAEEALRESEERLRSLAENVPCVLMRFDRQLRVVYLSKQSDRYNPNPAERMTGRTNREMGMPEHLCDLWDAAIERVFRTGNQEEMDFEFAGPSGMRTFALKFAPEFGPDHEVQYVLGVSSDITDRKLAEEALREARDHLEIRVKERTAELVQANRMLQEEVAERIRMGDALESSRRLLRHIIDHTPALVYVFDMEERLLVANKALGDLLSRLPEELIGKKRHEFMAKNIAGRDEENDRHVIAARVPMIFEEAGTFEGDEVITFLTVKFPIRNENGEIYAVGGISTDITERKQMEEALIRAKEAAEAATRAKAEFLASMSHEIRTPMNAVIGMTGLLLEEPLTPEQRENLEHIRINGDALLTLINDILDFSKMESDKVVLEEYQFNLRQCVEESLDLVALRASEKGINLAYAIDKNAPDIIIGDSGRLRQVLGNLLSNAVKFTDKGEVTLSVSSPGD